MRRLRDPEIRQRLQKLDEQRAEETQQAPEPEEEWENGGLVNGSPARLGDHGVVIDPENEELVWHNGEPYIVRKDLLKPMGLPVLSRWPWQRCKAKDVAAAGPYGYALRCDRKKGHAGSHYVERAFESYWFSR